jgi:acetyltransferase-like isoleucine patch superfamily enzyme
MFEIIKEKIKLKLFRKKFRLSNNHNFTYAVNLFPLDIVSIGKATYGPICIQTYGAYNENLSIGNFCSIAKNVTFLLGGNIT